MAALLQIWYCLKTVVWIFPFKLLPNVQSGSNPNSIQFSNQVEITTCFFAISNSADTSSILFEWDIKYTNVFEDGLWSPHFFGGNLDSDLNRIWIGNLHQIQSSALDLKSPDWGLIGSPEIEPEVNHYDFYTNSKAQHHVKSLFISKKGGWGWGGAGPGRKSPFITFIWCVTYVAQNPIFNLIWFCYAANFDKASRMRPNRCTRTKTEQEARNSNPNSFDGAARQGKKNHWILTDFQPRWKCQRFSCCCFFCSSRPPWGSPPPTPTATTHLPRLLNDSRAAELAAGSLKSPSADEIGAARLSFEAIKRPLFPPSQLLAKGQWRWR